MPGLTGIFETALDRRIDVAVLAEMAASLMHRKWYREDTHVDVAAGVAVTRIHHGTINPETQPYVSDDGTVKVFLDGEIYNEEAAGQQLKWIAAAYRRYGTAFPAQLNGSFAVIVLDAAEKRVVIATDRTASRPVYYWQAGTTLYLAPELKALLAVPELPRQLDWRAAAGFLASGFWLNGYTPLEGVRLLDGATALTLSASGLRSQRYWEYRFVEGPADLGEKYYHQTLADLVRTSVRRRVRSSHRYGVLLSGGYDSRGLLGCYLEERPESAVTISWGEDEHTPHSDCWVARRVAARVGATHHYYPLRPGAFTDHVHETVRLSDGMTAACGNYPEGLAVFAAIREKLGVQILLRGDECLGWRPGPFDERTMFESLGIRSLDDVTQYRSLLLPEGSRRLHMLGADLVAEISARCSAIEIHNRKDFFYLDQRLKYLLNPLNYLKTLEIEVRRPYLDNDILDFVTTLPVKYRLDKALFRRTIVQMFPNLYQHFARHTNLIDWRRQFRTDPKLQEFVHHRLAGRGGALAEMLEPSEASLRAAGRPSRLKALGQSLKCYPWLYETFRATYRRALKPRHVKRAPVTPDIIFRLLTLRLWNEQFLDGGGGAGSPPTSGQ